MWNGISGDTQKLRVLVAAADAETMSDDSVNDEVRVIEKTLSEFGNNNVQVKGLCTLQPRKFCESVAKFSPNIIHFTRHGSPTHNIKMLDSNGWVRRITGNTLAKYIFTSGLEDQLSAILLFGCDVYRYRGALNRVAKFAVIGVNKWGPVDDSISMTQAFYRHAGETRSINGGIEGLQSEFKREVYRDSIEIDVQDGLHREYPDRELLTKRDLEIDNARPVPERRHVLIRPEGAGKEEQASRLHIDSGATDHIQPDRDGPRQYRVWFGTNRAPKNVRDLSRGFGPNRAQAVTYGYCDVTIPKYHRIGSIGDRFWERFPKFWRNNKLSINERRMLEQKAYWKALRERFNQLSTDERVLLIFLHGYNVSFDQAAIRAAQFGCDLSVPGETAFFSWPSKGRIAGYAADIAAIEASEQQIADFIADMAHKSEATQVHIIAHSMGNLGLLRAFQRILTSASAGRRRLFKQIFLAAPDVDVGLFTGLCAMYTTMSQRTTMYVSARDRALRSSGLVRDYPRAGFTPPITVVDGVDTIEVSNIDLSFLGHGYVSGARPVLADMQALMRHDGPPGGRFGIATEKTPAGLIYWTIQP